MQMRRTILSLTLIGLLFPVLPGCASKVSQENYDKVSDGMTVAEVEAVLGKGTESSSAAGAIGDLAGSGKIMKWTSGEKEITITFVNGKVAARSAKGM